MAFDDGIKVGPIAYIGLVSAIVLFALVLALQVVYHQQRNRMVHADLAAEGPPHELAELTAKQQTALTRRGYADRERGIVTIGIKRAKELVVRELANGKTPSEVVGPKRPAASPTEPAAKPATGKPPGDTVEAGKKAAKREPTIKKQEPKDDKKS